VLEAVMIFRDANCGVVPVTDAGKPVGVLTDRDVALALPSHESDLGRTPVCELMSKDVVTIDIDETLDAAMDKLGEYGICRLLVVDGNDLLQGILSWSDLVPHLTPCGLGRVVSRIVENR
jgi:CBS domain-containing protein